jgi:parallel beta-helix repeat protein
LKGNTWTLEVVVILSVLVFAFIPVTPAHPGPPDQKIATSLSEKTSRPYPETGSVRVMIVLKYQPLGAVSAKKRHDFKELDRIDGRKRVLMEKVRLRVSKGKTTTDRIEHRTDVLAHLTPREKARLRRENLRAKHLKGQMVKDIQKDVSTLMAPSQERVSRKVMEAGGRVTGKGAFFNVVFAEIPAGKMEEIGSLPEVESVEPSRSFRPLLHVSVPSILASAFWNASFNGSPYAVAIVDTGVNWSHPALAGAYIGGIDVNTTDCDSDPDDKDGHGTHVAGIVASNDSFYRGVAYGASILNAKVFTSNNCSPGSWIAWEPDIMTGIDWAVNNGADVISGSFGGEVLWGYTGFERYFDAVVDDLGIFVAIAAGNDGPNSSTILSPGISYNVMTVGAMDDKWSLSRPDDSIWDFSSRGPVYWNDDADDPFWYKGRIKPDIMAPGNNILSTNSSGSGFVSMSGTSMATPHISGAAALLMAAGVSDPREIKALLINTAENRSNWSADDYGWGYADLNHTFYHINDVQNGTINSTNRSALYYKGYNLAGDKSTLVWNKHTTYAGNSSPSSFYNLSDIDLHLYSATTGAELDNSTSWRSNVEQVISPVNDWVVVKVYKCDTCYFDDGIANETFALATEEGFTLAQPPSLDISVVNPGPVDTPVFNLSVNLSNTGGLPAHNVSVLLATPAALIVTSYNPATVQLLNDSDSILVNFSLTASSDGNYTINATANSTSYGEAVNASSANVTITVDAPPQITIISPRNTTYNQSTVNLTYSIYNPFGINWTGYSLDGAANVTLTGNITLPGLTESPHNLTLHANDSSGNMNSSTVFFTVHFRVHNNTGYNFSTIQEAVDGTSPGGTITVEAGTYIENVKVNKSLNLIGAGADVTVVQAASQNDHVFEITTNNVNISGFTVTGAKNPGYAGIRLTNSNYSILEKVYTLNNSIGIYLSNSNNNNITNNSASSNKDYGMLFSVSDHSAVSSNNVANNNHGIFLYESKNNTLLNNNVSNNTDGIYIDSSSNNTIKENTVKENYLYDLYIKTGSKTHCDNIVENNTGSGDRLIKYLNYSVNLSNEIFSELILCNADNSSMRCTPENGQ